MSPALLPAAPYIPNPDARRDRAESEVLRLQEKLEAQEIRLRLLLRTVHNQHALLAAIGKEDGEHCDSCLGTGRDLLGQRVNLLDRFDAEQLRELTGEDWDWFDDNFPDDCPETSCFDGFVVEAPV